MSAGIVISDYSGTSEVSLRGRLLEKRILMLTGEITNQMAEEFVTELLCVGLDSDGTDNKFRIYMNSPGGSIDAGLMILDALHGLNKRVELVNIGSCSSMAAIILAAGAARGNRYIVPHGKTMIHQPLIHGYINKNTSNVKEMADDLIETKDKLFEILSQSTGKSIDELEKVTESKDYVMDAKESIAFGICDHIITDLFG